MDFSAIQSRLDTSNMLARIDEWPEIFQKGFNLGYGVELSPTFTKAKHVVGLGMGGSGMAYTILATMARSVGKVSIEVVSDYALPSYVTADSNTVVCITSFSGDTEEPLEAVAEALKRGVPIVCIATGGKLAQFAKDNNLPLAQFSYPVGPRTGLSYTFGIAFGVMCKAGFLQFKNDGPGVVKTALDGINEHVDLDRLRHSAQTMAQQLLGKLVFMVGSGWSYPVAVRWKGQMNENAKQIAFVEAMPEMCHNMYLGYDLPVSIRTNSAVVFLHSKYDHPHNLKRAKLIGEDFAAMGITVIHPEVSTELSHLGTLIAQIMFGDYVSYYLALLNKKDPADDDRIEELKKRL